MVSLINYDRLVKDSLKLVVKRALEQTAEQGLSGDQHFFITFLTDFPGVNIPDYLENEYPEELTIVLENQFWNLKVLETKFSVALNFNSKIETIEVPFDAIVEFSDPSEDFVLQFEPPEDGFVDMIEMNHHEIIESIDDENNNNKVISLDLFRKK
jgi:hypothetical protein